MPQVLRKGDGLARAAEDELPFPQHPWCYWSLRDWLRQKAFPILRYLTCLSENRENPGNLKLEKNIKSIETNSEGKRSEKQHAYF